MSAHLFADQPDLLCDGCSRCCRSASPSTWSTARSPARPRTSCSAASTRPRTLVEEYRTLLFADLRARRAADRRPAEAEGGRRHADPATVEPIAERLPAAAPTPTCSPSPTTAGRCCRSRAAREVPRQRSSTRRGTSARPGRRRARSGREARRLLLIVIRADPHRYAGSPTCSAPLILGVSLDDQQARAVQELTNSEIAFGVERRHSGVDAAATTWPALAHVLEKPGVVHAHRR